MKQGPMLIIFDIYDLRTLENDVFVLLLITLLTTKITYFVIDVSTSHRKSSSGLTSGGGRQHVRICMLFWLFRE